MSSRTQIPDSRSSTPTLSRRDLLRSVGAGLLLLVALPEVEAQESGGGGRRRPDSSPQNIGAWLHIAANGEVTVYTGKVEVGQNARTSLSQAVAEELRVPVGSVHMVMGDTDLTPYDMGTFGSRTTPTMVPQLRKAAAAARETLLDLAAAQWKVDRSVLTAGDGKVTQATAHRSLSYGELVKGEKLTQTIPFDIALTPAAQWHVMGTPTRKADGHAFVTGRHQYTTDVKRPGMLYGKILRPAAFHATLKSLDAQAAKAMPGVTVLQDADVVGVTAPTMAGAMRALAALKPEWQTVPQPSDQTLYQQLRPGAKAGRASDLRVSDSASGHTIEATYTIAYIAHTPLEPRAAVAEWKDGRLTVWTGTQRPFGVRGDLAAAFKIPESSIRVIVPDTGSGYGGKHTAEVAIEAAKLAKAAGKPVKLVWTREEEFTWAYFRPAGVIDVKASVQSDGTLTRWEFDNYNSGPSGIGAPYAVPGQRSEFHRTQAPLREGSYRGLAATANHFARESHIDDLAHAVKMDPLAFRMKNLQDARLKAVLEAAAARFGWDKRKAVPGRGYGLACGTEKGSYVAACAELTIDHATGKVQVTRIVASFECGAIVNPLHLENQVEGSLVMGMGGALFEAIRFDQGKILNPHLAAYRVPRFSDVPPIEIVLLDRKDILSAGAGETPIVAIAPAIRNAILDATGQALYTMPLVPNGLKA
ncbi:MAG: aldehyde oxidase and xanthine dehydrogenase, molybdopterin binding [Chthonomonadaceae bacterium]|nr:aldehyde oxidase and xanthine dehydrogenase, molybdopterin binding [Chthonomonadaceae bacterium]